MRGAGCRSGDDLSYSPFKMLRLRLWKVGAAGQWGSRACGDGGVQDAKNNVRAACWVWVELQGSAKKMNIFYISTYLHVTTNSKNVRPLSVIDIKKSC